MISKKSALRRVKTSTRFRYIDRGKAELLVLIPGWASDWRIFSTLDLEFNYLLPLEFSAFTFARDFLEELKQNNIKRFSLLGWSLGGFLAAEFAGRYPQLLEQLILVSIRKNYPPEILKEVSNSLQRNKKGYLYQFYKQWCLKKTHWQWFKENLLNDYCHQLKLSYLLRGLDYLGQVEIRPELLSAVKKLLIIHSQYDNIAPIAEALDIHRDLLHARFVRIKDSTHLPFLKNDFSRYLDGQRDN